MDKEYLQLELFQEWKKKRDYKNFCEDGILVNKEFELSNPKILFLLKESKSKFTKIKGPLGPEGDSKVFWRNIKLWSLTITKIFNNQKIDLDFYLNEKEKPNTNVAYINIKKDATINSINSPYSELKDIKSYAISDSEFLRRQINIINPDIILCGGTFCFSRYLFNDFRKVDSNLHFRKTNQFWIDFYHPSCRKSYYETNDLLIEYLKKISSI